MEITYASYLQQPFELIVLLNCLDERLDDIIALLVSKLRRFYEGLVLHAGGVA